MILEFSLKNYRSFREETTLSMAASSLKSQMPDVDENNTFFPQATGAVKLLRTSAIYGANASGKSNIIHAIGFAKSLVINSARESQANDPIPTEPFLLHADSEHEPSLFEFVFYHADKRYRYGFEVDQELVHREWLYHVPKQRESMLFQRDGQSVDLSGKFREGRNLIAKTRQNALFLSVVSQFNGEISTRLLNWFKDLHTLETNQDFGYKPFTIRQLENPKRRDRIMDFLKKLDLGFSALEVSTDESDPEELFQIFSDDIRAKLLEQTSASTFYKEVTTIHNKYNNQGEAIGQVRFNLNRHESQGTQKIVALSGPILDVLSNGLVLFLDEIDARMHPLLTQAVISLFHSSKTNPNNAQLVFVTHDTNLLSPHLFRRDQLWFVKKNLKGESQLYSLAEFSGVRSTAQFEEEYLTGRFGGIPYIGALKEVVQKRFNGTTATSNGTG